MKPAWILFCFLFSFPWMSWGQEREEATLEDKPLRLEIPADSDKETYRIIPCGDKGMILFYQSVERTSDNSAKWYFSFYDQYLQQQWIRNAPIDASLYFRDAVLTNDTLHLFFETTEKKKNRTLDFQILRIHLTSGSLILNNGVLNHPAAMVSFFVQNQKAYIGLNEEQGKAWIMILDLPTGTTRDVVLGSGEGSALTFLGYNATDNDLLVMLQQPLPRQSNSYTFFRFDLQGNERSRSEIQTNSPAVRLNNSRLMAMGHGRVLINGSYTKSPRSKKEKVGETTGVYSTLMDHSLQGPMTLINFLDLKNIRELLSERDILSLRKKSLKNKRPGEEYSLDLSLVMHDIMTWNDTALLAVETYYPQFHTESFTDYDFYGRPYTNSYNVFDGYRFTGFMLLAFDKNGNLLWDNVMDFRNVVRYSLEPTVTVFPFNDEIILAYLNEGKIATKIISGGNTIEPKSYADLMLMDPNEKLIAESKGQLLHWYKNYFLCYGYHEIRHISDPLSEKRFVFFCNKVAFER